MTLILDVPPSTVAKWSALTQEERQRLMALIAEIIDASHEEAFRTGEKKNDVYPNP